MKPNTIIIALVGIIILLTYLQTRSCHKEPAPSAPAVDQAAMMRRVGDSVRQLQQLEDSLIIRKKDREIDSLVPLANLAKKQLNDQGKKIAGTLTAVRQAKDAKDTGRILSNCDSLQDQVIVAGRLLGGYEYLNDSLITLMQEQRRIQDSLEAVYRRKEQLLTSALDSSDIRVQQLEARNKKLEKKVAKRWGFGPGASGTYLNGKPQPILEVGIHYDIFRF